MMCSDINFDDDDQAYTDHRPAAQGYHDGVNGLAMCPNDLYDAEEEQQYTMAHRRGARVLADRKAAL